ncbi:SpoU_methylase domain-containing protein [Psidium guajava]|nr:SpoU_methylase domain-containing protein [Psidium guajava]
MGDSYIALQTTPGKRGAYLYDIHFWIGKDTSQDEAGTAGIKTIELETAIGGRAVHHRELQGHESDKFLSYFKPWKGQGLGDRSVLKEEYHEGKCDVAIVDDGKLDTESDSGEFWVLLGGFAPIGKKISSEDDAAPEASGNDVQTVGQRLNSRFKVRKFIPLYWPSCYVELTKYLRNYLGYHVLIARRTHHGGGHHDI